MYYFENDPLQAVYADLAKDKTKTHFDQVLALKGTLFGAFLMVADKVDSDHGRAVHAWSEPRYAQQFNQ